MTVTSSVERHGASPPPRTRDGRRGFFLLDMMVTLVLVTVLMAIIVQLIGALLRTGRELADTGRQSAAIDRAVTLLRRDVLNATLLTEIPNGCQVGNGVSWTADADTLVRKSTAGEERFGPLVSPPHLSASRDVVHLRLGEETTWTLRRLTSEAR